MKESLKGYKGNDFWKGKSPWYKGNLHIHTNLSDGDLSPSETVGQYENAGYDFLSITDHDRLVSPDSVTSHTICLIPGEEISIGKRHVVGIGIKKVIVANEKTGVQDVIDEIRKQDGIAIVAHPYFSGMNVSDFEKLKNYHGIEVFNTSVHHNIGKGFSLQLWDDILLTGRRPYGFFADDAHYHFSDHRPNDICGSWIMVKASERTPAALTEAIKNGHFYASNGPAIENIEMRDRHVFVKCSPVKVINFIAPCNSGKKFTAMKSESISEAAYELRAQDTYVRIQCIDSEGNYAVSNPVFPESR